MAGVAAHHLDDHDAIVGFRRRVQAVDRIGGDLHGGLETERHLGTREIVVDGLRDTDHRHPFRGQLVRDPERVLAADRDECVDPESLHRGPDRCGTAVGLVWIGP